MKQNNVILRPMTQLDIPALAKLATNAKITDTLRDGFPQPYTKKDGQAYLAKIQTYKTP